MFAANVSGFNVPRAFDGRDLLEPEGLQAQIVPNALIVGRKREPGFAVEIFDENLERVGFGSPQLEAQYASFVDPLDLQRAASACEVLDRRCLYLGILHGHFGHFLIESLARAWAVLEREPDIALLFYLQNAPFVINDYNLIAGRLPVFVQTVFELLGLKSDELLFASGDLRVSKLVVPRPQFTLSRSGTRDLCRVYDRLSEAACASSTGERSLPKKVYFTRRALHPGNAAARRKSVANEDRLEAIFKGLGFEVLALETIPFVEQIRLVAGATHLAGTTGSALHMFLFGRDPSLKTYAIDWRNSRTQYILDAGRGHDAAHIYCFAGRDETGRPLVDADLVRSVMQNVLDDSSAAAGHDLADESEPIFSHDALASGDCRAEFDVFHNAGHKGVNPQVLALLQFLRRAQHLLANRSDSLEAIGRPLPPTLPFLEEFVSSSKLRLETGPLAILTASSSRTEHFDHLEKVERRHPLSLMLMEGFFDTENPQASVTILDELRNSSIWGPLLIMPNTLVVAQRKDLALWNKVLIYHGPSFFKSYGPFRMRGDVEFDRFRVITLRGSVVRTKAAADMAPAML